MKKLAVLLGVMLCPMFAYGFETHASLGLGINHNYLHQNDGFKGGLTISAPVINGIGWWSWTGLGENAKNERWVSHSQGIDFSFKSITTGISYKVSKDRNVPNSPFENDVSLNVKIKLW